MPKFSDPGFFNSLPLLPPFYFEDMTARIFPLRSSVASLQNFLDRYMNEIPPEVGRFRALAPYTCLMMIDYGKLAAQAANLGWLAQHEVMFAVPVGWYRLERGQWKWAGMVWVTPFIFVDSDIALTLGRQVYGWPKLLQQLTPTVSDWMTEPRAAVRSATLSTNVFEEVYRGESQRSRVFLEVDFDAPSLQPQIPFDLSDPFLPWNVAKNFAENVTGAVGDMGHIARGLGFAPPSAYGAANASAFLGYLQSMMTNPSMPELAFNTLNLKQFRDAEHPAAYCYQAMTAAKMMVKSFNRGGMLGDASALAGDATGGYRIRISKWPSLPIIDTLGLDVARSWQGDGVEVVELEPVRPFWYEVDMTYERGENLCWRTFGRVWHDMGKGRYVKPPSEGQTPAVGALEDSLYNTTLKNSTQTITGPFEFLDSTMRVLPLLASKAKLKTFLDAYLNDPLANRTDPKTRFEVWANDDTDTAHVYLVITDFGDVSSATDNIGNWITEDAAFFVPVKLYRDEELSSLGLVPVFTYVGDTTLAISRTEVQGWPTTKAVFERPPNVWLDDPSEDAPRTLVTVSAEVLPSLAEGQEAVSRELVEVCTGRSHLGRDEDRIAEQWGPLLIEEIERKNATAYAHREEVMDIRALALELLANQRPLNVYTLKQFRDVYHPEQACYQSLMRIPRTLQHVHDVRAFSAPLVVRIQQYPSQPIVDLLGLKATLTKDTDGGQDYFLFPVRPFWARVAWREGLGEQLCYRSGSVEWHTRSHAHRTPWVAFFDAGNPAPPTVNRRVVERIDDGDPAKAKAVVNHPEAFRSGPPLTMEAAKRAVETIDPQMAIDALASHEWGNSDSRSRWRQRRDTLNRRRKRTVEGHAQHERPALEIAFLRAEIKRISERRLQRFQPWVVDSANEKVAMMAGMARARDFADAAHAAQSPEDAAVALQDARLALHSDPHVVYPPVDTSHIDVLSDALEALLAHDDFDALFAAREDAVESPFREIVELSRDAYRMQRRATLDTLAKAAQEPEFCIPRNILGEHWSDRLFPRRHSWKGFYVGRDPALGPNQDDEEDA